jgi:hypothetical protein
VLTISSADYTEHSIACYCWIDSAGTVIYNQTVTVDSVIAGGTAMATFPAWNVGPTGNQYQITMFNTFPDASHADDTLYRTTEAVDQIQVLIAYADGQPDSLIVGLRDLGDSVATLYASSATPTLDELRPYDGVVTFSNSTYQNPVAMGDVLADFADLGRAVVIGTFAFTSGWHIQGRIITGDYATLVNASNSHNTTDLGWFDPAHPIMSGVTTVHNVYVIPNTWAAGSDSVAKWQNEMPLVATSTNQRVVGINCYPGPSSPDRGGRDWVKMYHQALLWASGGGTGIADKAPFSINPNYVLSLAKPNPMSKQVTISYNLPNPVPVEITVYDLGGKRVTTLVSGAQKTGWHNVSWNRTDGRGNRVASGVYFYSLKAGSYSATRKLVVN